MISVIVPVYNAGKYLSQCLDSILNQTYSNFELILVDDGSKDNSGLICDLYAKRDSRIRVVHVNNGGQATARNIGISMAHGDYYSFVDADDWIKPNMFETLYNSISSTGADIAVCSIQEELELADRSAEPRCFWVEDAYMDQSTMLQMQTKENAWIYVGPCNKLIRSSLFDDIRFPEGYIYEDAAIWHRLLGKSSSFVCVNEALYVYRIHNTSTMHSSFSIRRTDHLSAWADRIWFTHSRGWKAWEQATIKLYTEHFFDYYFRFHRSKENEIYFKRMEQSLKGIFPYILQDRKVSIKHKLYFFLISLNPAIYTTIRKVLRR